MTEPQGTYRHEQLAQVSGSARCSHRRDPDTDAIWPGLLRGENSSLETLTEMAGSEAFLGWLFGH